MKLSFTQITSATWEHSKRFGFFRKLLTKKMSPSPLVKSLFENTFNTYFFKRQGVEVSPGNGTKSGSGSE